MLLLWFIFIELFLVGWLIDYDEGVHYVWSSKILWVFYIKFFNEKLKTYFSICIVYRYNSY